MMARPCDTATSPTATSRITPSQTPDGKAANGKAANGKATKRTRLDPMTPCQAREAARLTLSEAARLARVGEIYLARIERHRGAPFVLARRLAHLYGCRIQIFL